MNKIVMCLMVMGFLALSVCAGKVSLTQMMSKVGSTSMWHDLPNETPAFFEHKNIHARKNYQKALPNWGGAWFSFSYKPSDDIAVQVVRTSDRYYYKDRPVLVMCILNNGVCVYDNMTESLSFEISGSEVNKTTDGKFHFILFTISKDNTVAHGVVVGLFACVNKKAALGTCTSPCYKNCANGFESKVMDVCVCLNGFTGPKCDEETGMPPVWDSEWEHHASSADAVIVFFTFAFIFAMCALCCCCCCRNCHQSRKNAANTIKTPSVVPPAQVPPPATPGYAYYPLGTVPPPPPPQQPQQCTTIEMATIPESKTIYCTPPVAPVTQVPILIQPLPVPKN